MARIAVDAMGGDRAPGVVVEGAVLACRELGLDVVLVGDETRIRGELVRLGAATQKGISIRHAPDVVEAGEPASQVIRKRRDTSLRQAFELLKAQEADAVMSAGHSGAVLAAALLVLEAAEGVDRPAIAALLPTLPGGRVALIDAGANVDVRPLHLVQFALMGDVYVRRVLGVARPRIGLIANGEEPSKGTALTRAAAEALAKFPGIDFRGYAEGKDVFSGAFDVLVTDGFTGNAILKTAEGTALAFWELLQRSMASSPMTRIGGVLLRPVLSELRRLLDYSEYGGAPLVGCRGSVVLAHGRSGPVAIRNAIRAAKEGTSHHLEEEMSQMCRKASQLLSDA